MPGIYVMAVITTLIGAAMMGAFIYSLSKAEDRRWLLVAALLALPLSPLVYTLVRLPIQHVVNPALEGSRGVLLFVQFLYAPLTEEPAKLLPLLSPALRRQIHAKNFVPFALALGAGFGLGEIWLVASFVAADATYAGMPFYVFTGFLMERLLVLVMHGFFTAAALRGLKLGYPAGGVLAAMLLHLLGNASIALKILDVGGLGAAAWTGIISLLTVLYTLIGMAVLLGWHLGKVPSRAHTHARCPECGTIYPRPFIVMNLPTKRYEQCPGCHHWHWIDRWADPDGSSVVRSKNA